LPAFNSHRNIDIDSNIEGSQTRKCPSSTQKALAVDEQAARSPLIDMVFIDRCSGSGAVG
jgi:hypothetical protein